MRSRKPKILHIELHPKDPESGETRCDQDCPTCSYSLSRNPDQQNLVFGPDSLQALGRLTAFLYETRRRITVLSIYGGARLDLDQISSLNLSPMPEGISLGFDLPGILYADEATTHAATARCLEVVRTIVPGIQEPHDPYLSFSFHSPAIQLREDNLIGIKGKPEIAIMIQSIILELLENGVRDFSFNLDSNSLNDRTFEALVSGNPATRMSVLTELTDMMSLIRPRVKGVTEVPAISVNDELVYASVESTGNKVKVLLSSRLIPNFKTAKSFGGTDLGLLADRNQHSLMLTPNGVVVAHDTYSMHLPTKRISYRDFHRLMDLAEQGRGDLWTVLSTYIDGRRHYLEEEKQIVRIRPHGLVQIDG